MKQSTLMGILHRYARTGKFLDQGFASSTLGNIVEQSASSKQRPCEVDPCMVSLSTETTWLSKTRRIPGRLPGLARVYSKLPKIGASFSPYLKIKGILKGIPAQTILKPCSYFLEFTVRQIGRECPRHFRTWVKLLACRSCTSRSWAKGK